MDFLRGGPIFGEKNGNRNRNEPEPVEPNRGFKDLGMNRTEPNRTVGFLLYVNDLPMSAVVRGGAYLRNDPRTTRPIQVCKFQ